MKHKVDLPDSGRASWSHPEIRGLEVRGNLKKGVWRLRHRINGKRVSDSLGPFPELSATEAAKVARVRLADVAVKRAAGADVLADREAKAESTRRQRATPTFGAGLDIYGEQHLSTLRTGDAAGKILADVFAPLMDKQLHRITRTDLVACVEDRRKRAATTADHAVRLVRPFYAWLEDTARADNIAAGMKSKQPAPRDRVLTQAELGAIWNALGDSVTDDAVKMIFTTGQRRNEVAAMEWNEVDLEAGIWTVPADRMKNAKPHVVPLSDVALETLDRRPSRHGLVFPSQRAGKPIHGWSKIKAKIDAASGVSGWRFHDARRTFATLTIDAGGDALAADRVLSHSTPAALSRVAGVYQRSQFIDQKRDVLDLWARIITTAARIDAGCLENSNVLAIGGAA